MYLSTFPLSEYCFNDEIICKNNNEDIIDDDICLICWMPSETNNSIMILSDFSHIVMLCKCKSKFHSDCLNIWIAKSHSCPICRKKIKIKNINRRNKYLREKWETVIRILYYFISFNVCYIFWYNIFWFISLY
jgi:hypothetical protein